MPSSPGFWTTCASTVPGQRTNQPGAAQLVALGEAAVALNSGGLRVVQDLDFDLSPGTGVGGSPALVYNSDTVHVRPVIQAELRSNEADPVPESIKVQLTFDGVTEDWITYTPDDLEPGDTYLLAAQVEDAVARSGIYAWTLHVVLDFGEGLPEYHAELSGNARVVANESPAPDPDHPFAPIDFFGAGWGLAGLDRLVLDANAQGDVLWVTGSGDSAIFTRNNDGTFTSPAFDFGTLKRNDDGSYTYTSKYQDRTEFDRLGLMTAQVDPNGIKTTYDYTDEGQLAKVTSSDGGVTTFTYDEDTLLLEKIEEPTAAEEGEGEEPAGTRALTFTHEDGNLTVIDELDNSHRTFTYDPDGRLVEDEWAGLNLDGTGVFDAHYTYDDQSGLLKTVKVSDDTIDQVTSMAALGLDAQYAPNEAPVLDTTEAAATIEDGLTHTTSLEMDFEGREIREISPLGIEQSWERDAHGQVVKYTDGRSLITEYSYNFSKKGAGDLTRVVNPDGSEVFYRYDAKFHQVTREQRAGFDGAAAVTSSTYDPYTGDLLSMTEASTICLQSLRWSRE